MSSPTIAGFRSFDPADLAALQRERMVALTDLLFLLLGGPMILFGIGFLLLLRDPWLGAEILAGIGELAAFSLNRRGRHDAARLLGCAIVALVYLDLVRGLGAHVGIEFWNIPMIALPPVLTVRGERRLLLAIYAMFIAAIVAAHASLFFLPPRIAIGDELAMVLRFINLVLTMMFAGTMIVLYYVSIHRAEATISRERERAERLLANILPDAISARLKRDEHPIADRFEDVTVLFADVVDFSGFAARNPPEVVVNLLNRLFYAFDDMVERHGLEKIKTIGDAYMVAAGIPAPRRDHAVAIAELSLEMIAFTAALGEPAVELRIGIHSGSVVAGVIGKRKFSYDLWGDTVNVASRLQTTSEPGRIQISEETRLRLGGKYEVDLRGEIALKGVAPTCTYFLAGRASGSRPGT